METHTPLINLALLETLKGEKINDEIDLFIPYTAIIISKIEAESFRVHDIKSGFKKEFGINPPESAIKSILTRAKKKRIISLTNGLYFKNHSLVEEISQNANKKKAELEDSLNRVLTAFQQHAKDTHEKDLSSEEAETFLYNTLTANLSILIGNIGGKRAQIETKIKNTEYLTATFIKSLFDTASLLTNDLNTIIKGIILSNYISYADKATNKRHLKNITLYLDTPIILGILGYSGHSKEVALREFLELIQSLQINIKIFDITQDEIQKLLHTWGIDLERKNYTKFNSKTLELLRAKGIDKARLETESALLEKSLNKLGINVDSQFKWEEQYNCDFAALERTLIKKGFENNLRHDINCAARTFNLRAGRRASTLNDKLDLFVTLNASFERLANSHLINELPSGSIPVVISERLLSTVLWLKNPNIYKNLPSKILLANAYSSIYSDDKFWQSFVTRLEQIKKRGEITEDDFLLVRWDKSLIDRIHQTSIDTGVEFEDYDVFDIVESIKKNSTQEANTKIEAIASEAAIALIQKEEIIQQRERESRTANQALQNIEQRIIHFSSGIAHLACGLAALLLITLTSYAILKALPTTSINPGKYITLPDILNSTAALLLLIFTILSLLFGFTFKAAYKSAHSKLSTKIRDLFLSKKISGHTTQ